MIQAINKRTHNITYHILGLVILFINKIRYTVLGYKSPRDFKITNFKKAIDYDFKILLNWQQILKEYSPNNYELKNKCILELGPGADLGIGLFTLMYGAKKYNAIDINNLVKSVPQQFYNELFKYINKIDNKQTTIDFLETQLKLTKKNENDKLIYIHDKKFNLSIFKKENIDLIFSEAAFEHFSDIEKTISSLSDISKPGTILIAKIDLQTHTKYLRQRDPLNIYRYSDKIYNLFKFKGSPNRVRPEEYKNILKKNSWSNIQIKSVDTLSKDYLSSIQPVLYKKFKKKDSQMEYLSIVIQAIKQ